MNKYIYKITALIALVVGFASCSDFLDIEPQDKILEDKVYESEAGINTLFNGIYLGFSKDSLYGKQLTMDATEILGQQFSMTQLHYKYALANYKYADNRVKVVFEGIWTSGYNSILSVNRFLENIDKHPGVISTEKTDLLKGEALAIRAMVHFDLLRLYGPIYTTDATKIAIPYYKEAKAKGNPSLPATEVMTNVLADIDMALTYLANDPIIAKGPGATDAFNGNPFYSNRKFRMNYFAVKALKARVLLYSGDKVGAYAVANEVINGASSWFPWTKPGDINGLGANADRIFSSEIIFALYNSNLYQNQTDLFVSDLSAQAIYAPNSIRLAAVYEQNDNDYRYLPIWKVPTSGEYTFKTFFKYADVQDKTTFSNRRFMQPLIKMSEMYLIAAESAPDAATGVSYLNTLRNNRNLIALSPTANLTTEVAKEYKKEFYGEGQLFFFYKRTNATTILKGEGTTTTGAGVFAMTSLEYVVPLPDSEKNFQ